jgi:hypothetical protein
MSGAAFTTTAELLGSTRQETGTLLNFATQIVTLSEDNRSDALKQALAYLDTHLPAPNPGRAFWTALLQQCRDVKDLDELHRENLFPSPSPLGLSDLFIRYASAEERSEAIEGWLGERAGLWNNDGRPSRRSNAVTGSHAGSRGSSRERDELAEQQGPIASGSGPTGKGKGRANLRDLDDDDEDPPTDDEGEQLAAKLSSSAFNAKLDQAAKDQVDRAAAAGARRSRARPTGTPNGGRRSRAGSAFAQSDEGYERDDLSPYVSPTANGRPRDTRRDDEGDNSGTRRSSLVRRFDLEARGLSSQDADEFEDALIRNLAQYAQGQPQARDEYDARTQDLAIAGRRMSKEDLERILKTLSLDMPMDVAVAIVRNEWVDLAKIHGWEEKSSEKVAVADDNDGTLRIKLGTQAKSVEPSTALQWQRAFGKYRALASALYPHRRDEFRRYEEYISRCMDDYGASAFALWYEYDGQYRRRLGTDGFQSRLDSVTFEQTLKTHVVFANKAFLQSRLETTSGSSSSKRSAGDGGKRSSKKGKTEKSRPQPTGQAFKCKNWNAKRGDCAGSGSCPHDRRHVCDFDGCSEAHRRVDAHKQ